MMNVLSVTVASKGIYYNHNNIVYYDIPRMCGLTVTEELVSTCKMFFKLSGQVL